MVNIYINAKLFEAKNKILENKTFLEVSIVTDFVFFTLKSLRRRVLFCVLLLLSTHTSSKLSLKK